VDLYCQRCGEPWDFYGVYNGDMTPEEKDDFLKGKGCLACKGKQICTEKAACKDCEHSAEDSSDCFTCVKMLIKRPFRAQLASALANILGEDTDGIAAEMEDAEYLLGKEFWEYRR
jgi:hypothetical protein